MIQPLRDRVVIRPAAPVEKTQGGLYIPEKAKEKTNYGEVIGVGEDVVQVKVGDTVLYNTFCGSRTEDGEDKNLLIIREDDLLAVVN